MPIRNISLRGLNLIKYLEGFRSKPYLCPAGVPTIGYGSTRYLDGKKVKLTDPAISEEEAHKLFVKTLEFYDNDMDALVRDDINQNQFDALVSFVYNVGITNFRNSKLLRVINLNPNDPEIANQFRRWKYANNRVSKILINRREKELALYFAK